VFVEQVKSVFTRDGPNPNETEVLGSALTSKRRRVILAYNSQPKSDRTFGTRYKLRYNITKLSLNEKGISVCLNRKQFQINFTESVWSIYELTICSVLRVS